MHRGCQVAQVSCMVTILLYAHSNPFQTQKHKYINHANHIKQKSCHAHITATNSNATITTFLSSNNNHATTNSNALMHITATTYRWHSWMSHQCDQITLPQSLALATHIFNDNLQHPNCPNHDKQLQYTNTSLLNLATTIKSIATFVISRTNNKLVAPRLSKRAKLITTSTSAGFRVSGLDLGDVVWGFEIWGMGLRFWVLGLGGMALGSGILGLGDGV